MVASPSSFSFHLGKLLQEEKENVRKGEKLTFYRCFSSIVI